MSGLSVQISIDPHKPQESYAYEKHSQPTEEPENTTPKLTYGNQVSHISLLVYLASQDEQPAKRGKATRSRSIGACRLTI